MKNRGDHAPVLSKSTVLIQPLLTAPTKGPYYQTLSTNPTEPGGFYNQPPLIVPKKLWQTPLNFDDPIILYRVFLNPFCLEINWANK